MRGVNSWTGRPNRSAASAMNPKYLSGMVSGEGASNSARKSMSLVPESSPRATEPNRLSRLIPNRRHRSCVPSAICVRRSMLNILRVSGGTSRTDWTASWTTKRPSNTRNSLLVSFCERMRRSPIKMDSRPQVWEPALIGEAALFRKKDCKRSGLLFRGCPKSSRIWDSLYIA